MGATQDIETSVPVREGEYGSRVMAIEPGGIEYIPERERHGRALDLFWTWMSPNMEFATIFVGFLPIAFFGMGFWDAALAIILGTALGSITHAVLSSWGPKFGVPQMVQSRGAFGFLGNILPAGLNAVTAGLGWFIVNSVSGAFALASLLNLDFRITFVVIVAAQVLVAFLGHNLVHRFERYAFPYLVIVFGIACVILFSKAHFDHAIDPKAQGPLGEFGAFTLTATAAFGYAVGWNPYASDYTRYLPREINRRMVGLAAGLGVFISCVLLELAGAAAMTIAPLGANPTDGFTGPLNNTLLRDLVLVGIALGAVAANVLNIYSSSMSFLTLGIQLSMKQRRAIVALTSGVLALAIGLAAGVNVAPGTKYESFLLLISYWIAPFLAIVITDYAMRGGVFDERWFFDSGRRPWRGVVAMALALLISVPFWNVSGLYVGPIPTSNPGVGDLTFLVGFVAAAVLYWGLNRGRAPVETAEVAA